MRSWLAAATLLQVLIAAPVQAEPALGPPLPGPLPWRPLHADAAPRPPPRPGAEAAPTPPRLLAGGRRLLPPVVDHHPSPFAESDFGRCVSEAERRAAAPSERFKAFRRNAVPIPPLLYLSQDRTFIEALFLYWSSTNVEERTKLRLLLPVFVWSCTPKNRTVVTPLFAHRDDAEGRAGFIGPYYYRRDRYARSDVLFPLFSRVVDRDQSTVTGLNFFYHRNRRGAHGGLVPLAFWGSYHDGSRYAVVPPLVFHTSDRDQSTTVVPPFYFRRHRGTPDFDVGLAPLYFGARHGTSYSDLVPPALFARWGDQRTTNVWWLTSYYRRDGRSWSFNLIPLYFGGRTGDDYHHVVAPPLFAHWGDRRRARTMVLNLYVRVDKRDDDWLFFLIPAALGFRSGSTFALLSPVVSHVSTPRSATTIVPPFYLFRDQRSLYTALMPLFFHAHRRDPRRGASSHTHVPPLLFFDVRDRRGATTVALNTYYSRAYRSDGSVDPREWDAGVIPLWFQGRSRDRRYLYLPPLLFFDKEDESSGERATIFPLGYRFRDRGRTSVGVVPFFFASWTASERVWVAPLLLSGHSSDVHGGTTVVGPFFQHRTPTSLHRGFVPLVFQGHTATYRYTVVPFLPFWLQREPGRTLVIVGPVFHSRTATTRDTGVVPLFFSGRAGPRRYTAVPPLLLFDWSDAAAGTRTTLFPVGYHHRHPGGWDFGLVPLVFASAHGAAHRATILPLLTFHWGDSRTERTIAGGLAFSFRAPGSRHHGLFPLVFWGARDATHPDGPSRYVLVAPPLFIHRRDAHSATTILAQSWAHLGRDGSWHGGSFPFYVGGRVPASGAYYDVAFPLFARWGARDRHRAVLLNGYFVRDASSWDFGLAPLLYFGANRAGGRYAYLFPVFWHRRTPERSTTVVLPAYYSGGRDGYDLGLAPIFFHGRRTDGRHYAHVAPFFWHWGAKDEEATVVFPLGFGWRERDRYARAITPLFYQWGDRRVGKSLLFPLAYLERDGASSLFLSPLVVSHVDAVADKQRLVVFPLFWRFASRDSQVNVAFPFWWDFDQRRASSRLTILFPLGFRYDKRDETMTMFLNVAYTRGKGRFAGAWSFHFVPLLELASFNPQHFKWQVLMGLFGRERQGRLSRWRIAYFWTEPH